ncbi:hypothetical protein BU24DRAFT_403653 [Aaosphaeria arxii CBS 175.79]|uniref:Uncharacterized protein n=1 Tax=Aaosphaeria arxii CBS 175.79 TaxID=1450172 RepID=A0A6A5Y6X2_9PLEO|nr:uncharacterized protein BU24DRAFT_403653 [Aaosphaeria arxii CBS 175.79]KAF2020550.1 hypothetical protein BU24DRAFT_403653 [Aaosphaeria arxii CBS 175.79]
MSTRGYTNATCDTPLDLYPNATILQQIHDCQAAANTSFCWPPNGSRICTPASEVRWFWPIEYFDTENESKVAIQDDLSSAFLFLRENTGNRTTSFTEYGFDYKAVPIPGKPYEKVVKIYMIERRFKGQNATTNAFNYEIHDAQTVTLVKSAEWTSTRTSGRLSGSTSTSSASSGGGGGNSLSGGKVAAIVVPIVLVATVILFFCCCKACCCGPAKNRSKTKPEQDAEAAAAGLQNAAAAMRQQGPSPGTAYTRDAPLVGTGPGQIATLDPAVNNPRRQSTDAVPTYDAPPPKYVP